MASSHYFSKAIHHEVNDVDIQYEVNDMDSNSPIFQELDKLMIKHNMEKSGNNNY